MNTEENQNPEDRGGGTDQSPERYDKLISENSFFLEKLHAEHDRRTRLKLEEMLAETPAIHFELDAELRLTYVNPTWTRELRHPVHEVIGRPLTEFVSPSDVESLTQAILDKIGGSGDSSETVICFIDGAGAPHWMSAKLRINRTGTISGNLQDVSVHRELENERLQTQKIRSIGRFAAGFAHDFNNLLMAITANLDIAQRKLASRDLDLKELALSLKACDHASQITKQLMNYSSIGQEQLPVVQPNSISDLVHEAVEIAFRGSQIQPIVKIDPDVPLVDMDSSQIHQVLNNLLINAEQAMPDGGVIRIRVRERFYAPVPNADQQEGVVIEIRDQGVGIPKEDLEQVLEPYFTTKEMGNGLGLTTAYWIIKHHGGLFEIDSARGNGTVVRVTLPVSRDQTNVATDPEPARTSVAPLTILVMDDDDSVREVMVSMLELLGHQCLSVRHGEECLDRYVQSLDPATDVPAVDLVIVDLVVAGGRGGLWTLDKLCEIDPDVPVLVSTGYSKDPVIEDAAAHGFRGALQKPYTLNDLEQEIARVMTLLDSEEATREFE
ncbi:MAG: ATP-binding protein [Planctomycetota bacterium]|nr:ATP-binding protein [Planctomycetota bacterium]